MRRVLEDAMKSGDVHELESAIIDAQNFIVTSGNPREENRRLSDVLIRCRKMLVHHLEECKPLLKPLRHACRHLDGRALKEALFHVQHAPPEVRGYMRTDIQKAEALRHRIFHADGESLKIPDYTDRRETGHFLNRNEAVLHDRMLPGPMQKRRSLPAEGCGKLMECASRSVFSNEAKKSNDEKKFHGAGSSGMLLTTEREEEDVRRILVEEEHSHRVLCLKSVIDVLALGLLRMNDLASCASTGSHPADTLAPSRKTDGEHHTFWMSDAATPDVSPIKQNSLPDSALETYQPRDVAGTSSAPVIGDDSSNCIVVEGAVSHLQTPPRNRLEVISPETWVRLRALINEEGLRRHDIDGSENFERSVFLLPMAARSALFTRLLLGRSLSRGQ